MNRSRFLALIAAVAAAESATGLAEDTGGVAVVNSNDMANSKDVTAAQTSFHFDVASAFRRTSSRSG